MFRNRERGALHAPEFTMLEWYRAGEPLEALMRDCAEIARPRGAKRRARGRFAFAAARPTRSRRPSG